MIPMVKLVADWNKEMQCTCAVIPVISPLTQSLVAILLPVFESPAPTLAPCVPMGNNDLKIWLDYLLAAIFDFSAAHFHYL